MNNRSTLIINDRKVHRTTNTGLELPVPCYLLWFLKTSELWRVSLADNVGVAEISADAEAAIEQHLQVIQPAARPTQVEAGTKFGEATHGLSATEESHDEEPGSLVHEQSEGAHKDLSAVGLADRLLSHAVATCNRS